MTPTNQTKSIPIGNRVSIAPRGKKRTWTAEFSDGGVHRRKSLHTRNKKVATQRAVQLEADLQSGTYAATPAPVSVADASAAYLSFLKTKDRAESTLTRYRGELRAFVTFGKQIGMRRLSQITPSLIDRYSAHRLEGRGLSTVYHELVVIKQLLKWSKSRGLVAANLIADYSLEKPATRKKPVLTLEQINAILSASTPYQSRQLAVLAFTGMRVSSLLALQRKWINWKIARMRVWDVKKRQWIEDFPIHPRLMTALRSVPDEGHELLFAARPSRRYPSGGQPVSPKRLNDYFKAAANRVGAEGFTLHDLRHFFKSFCVNNGVPERAVDQWLNHSDGSVRGIYYHLTREESKRFMDTLPFGTAKDT